MFANTWTAEQWQYLIGSTLTILSGIAVTIIKLFKNTTASGNAHDDLSAKFADIATNHNALVTKVDSNHLDVSNKLDALTTTVEQAIKAAP